MDIANACLISHHCDICSNKVACDDQETNAPLPLLDPTNLGKTQFLAVVRKDECLDCPKLYAPSLKLMKVVVSIDKIERKLEAIHYSYFGEYKGSDQGKCGVCGKSVFTYKDCLSVFYDNPEHPNFRDVEFYHGKCYEKTIGIDWTKVDCNVDEHHNLPRVPKERLLYTGPGSMTPAERASVSIAGYGKKDLESRGLKADKEPKPKVAKPIKEDRSVCYRCGDPASVSIGIDHHSHGYCSVCAYIIEGFIANSFAVPIESIIGKWTPLMGVCPECHSRVYSPDDSYEARIDRVWDEGLVFHQECYPKWKLKQTKPNPCDKPLIQVPNVTHGQRSLLDYCEEMA